MKLKKILAVCLSACMISGCFAGVAMAATDDDEEKDYTISDAYWDTDNDKAMASWDEPDSKTSYKIELYKGSTKKGGVKSSSTDHYNFTSQIVDLGSGTYYFAVYPTKGGKDMAVVSPKLVVGSGDDADISISDLKSSISTSSDKTTTSSSGGPGVSTSTNSPATGNPGWNQTNGRWWYLEGANTPATNKWILDNSHWYYFGSDGYMQTGWQWISDKCYYLEPTGTSSIPQGSCYIDTTTPDGYKVDASGAWIQ